MPRLAAFATRRRRLPLPAIATTFGVIGLLSAAVVVEGSWLERSIERALAVQSPPAIRLAAPPAPPIAGSESFWLSPAPNPALVPATYDTRLVVGSLVKLGAPGRERTLEVVEIRPLEAAGPADVVEGSAVEGSDLLVSLRDPAGDGRRIVRLILGAAEADLLAGATPRPDHAL